MLKFISALTLFFLWTAPAWAVSPPTVDTNNNACGAGATACPTQQFTGTSGVTAGIATNSSSGCLVVLIAAENSGSNNSPSVSSVTGGTNVASFVKRGTPMTGNSTGFFGAQSDDSEVWYAAYSAALTTGANAVTVTMSASTDGVAFTVLVVTGTFNGVCSWDTHAQATATASWTSGVSPGITQVTNQADDFLFIGGVQGTNNTATSGTPSTFAGTGGTIAGSACEAAGARSTCQGTFYETVTATQNISDVAKMVNGASSLSSQGYATVDALTANNNTVSGATPINLFMYRGIPNCSNALIFSAACNSQYLTGILGL